MDQITSHNISASNSLQREKNILMKTHQLTFESEDTENVNKIAYKLMKPKEVTFKGGLEFPIHRWFVLTPSFSPILVNEMLHETKTTKNHVVLDPFAGIGTTLLECKKKGLSSIGVEINPILYKIINGEINWEINHKELEREISHFILKIKTVKSELRDISIDDLLKYYNIDIPKLHDIFRWWRKDVLFDLLIARETIKLSDFSRPIKELLELGIACILTDVANVTRGRLQLAFIDRTTDSINIFDDLEIKLNQISEDIKYVKQYDENTPCKIINGDSTKLNELITQCSIDRVITSPPYPNRYSYVWNTRAHLFFFDLFTKPSQSADLDKKSIGGTWGTATSILANGIVEPYNDIVKKELEDVTEKIRVSSNLMANYVMKYFNLMAIHIENMVPILSDKAQCAYVVGNSEIKGQLINTDEILGSIFKSYGFDLIKIVRVRKRNSGAGLHEAIVYVMKT